MNSSTSSRPYASRTLSLIAAAMTVTAVAAALGSLGGCNTTEGVGKDIESAGAGLKEAAQDAKN